MTVGGERECKIEYDKPETPGEEPLGASLILWINSRSVGGWEKIVSISALAL
jgi:hypothetical protein